VELDRDDGDGGREAMTLDDIPLDVVLTETAELYETVASLPAVVERAGAKVPSVPGSRMPPGMAEVLDVDEHQRALTELDDWALYVAHHLLDVEPGIGSVPDSTPGRLRLAARWAGTLSTDPDEFARYDFELVARDHLVTMRRLSRRGTRSVPTTACLDVSCDGTYVATIAGADASDEIRCARCGDVVPRETWERWGARSEWVSVERAAGMLGVSVAATKMRASRGKWRRTGTGRDVRYLAEDVRGETSGRMSA
jgi:ribosomal protein S27E